MKAKFLMIAGIAGLFAVTSCKNGPNEETQKAVNDVESALAGIGHNLTLWGDELKASVAECNDCCSKNATLNMETWNEEFKAKGTQVIAACLDDKAAFESIWMDWETFKTTWEETSKTFGEWKEKVSKGEIDAETAKNTLAEYQAKVDEGKSKLDGWNAAYDAAKEACIKNMEACQNLEKMAAEVSLNK